MTISSSNKNITGQLISVNCWKLCKHFKVIICLKLLFISGLSNNSHLFLHNFAPDLYYVFVYFHIVRKYFQFSHLLQILYKILR